MNDDYLGVSAAAAFWRLSGPATQVEHSTNGPVRRFGRYWLKGRSSRRECEREIRAMRFLSKFSNVEVPPLVRNIQDSFMITVSGRHWFVEESLEGCHPDVNSLSSYLSAGIAIRELHLALKSFEDTVDTQSARSEISEALKYDTKEPIMIEAKNAIIPRLSRVSEWEVQTIHGDLSHPNLILSPGKKLGFIDFEFLRRDARAFDIAVPVITAICRSSLSDYDKAYIVEEISVISNLEVNDVVLAALIKRWLATVSNLSCPGGPSAKALSKQLSHINTLILWLNITA